MRGVELRDTRCDVALRTARTGPLFCLSAEDLVQEAVALAKEMGRPVATAAQAVQLLDLPPGSTQGEGKEA